MTSLSAAKISETVARITSGYWATVSRVEPTMSANKIVTSLEGSWPPRKA